MKKRVKENVCANCGGALDPSASVCAACGETVLDQVSAPVEGKKAPGFWNVFFSVIVGLLLTVSTTLLALLLFMHGLNETVRIPAVGPISGDWLAVFFDAWYPFVLGGAFVLIPLLIIVLINTHRIRRIFLTVGVSATAVAVFSVVFALFETQVVKMLSGEWQEALVNSTAVLKDFFVLYAIIMVVIGAACLSVYSCITVVKGARHEQNT